MLPPPDAAGTLNMERISSSPIAWLLTGLLLVIAAYFLIRMIEWDLINRQTENQEDPLDR